MAQFRKKPVIIEAVQWLCTAKSWEQVNELGVSGPKWSPGEMGSGSFYINTLEGKLRVDKNDWIIKGVNGAFYPCNPDIFEKTYEAVNN